MFTSCLSRGRQGHWSPHSCSIVNDGLKRAKAEKYSSYLEILSVAGKQLTFRHSTLTMSDAGETAKSPLNGEVSKAPSSWLNTEK